MTSLITPNDAADYWRSMGVNVLPADTIRKITFEIWSQWQDKQIPADTHEEWKRNGSFSNGMALIPGKIWSGPYAGKYLVAIDLDNQKAIEEFCKDGLELLKQKTLVEQHSDTSKMHVYFIVERPIPNKSSDKVDVTRTEKIDANQIPAIEVKSNGKGIMYCSISPHSNGSTRQITGTYTPEVFEASDVEDRIRLICEKYGLLYGSNGNGSNSNKIPIEELFKPETRILEGHNRHEALLRVMESLLRRNQNILTLEQIKNLSYEWNQIHCVPPLDNRDFEDQWTDALNFIKDSIYSEVNNGNGHSNTSEESESEDEETEEQQQHNTKSKKKKKDERRVLTTLKYSQMGTSDLYESVFVGGFPCFTRYNNITKQFEKIGKIEETTRILVPPAIEECPHLRYEFESMEEINSFSKFIDDNKIDLDYLYSKSFEMVSQYNNQSKHKLRLLTIDIILSHFQDRFPTCHYLYPVGGNGSGKSSIAYTFRAIGYRTVVMTDPSAPNLFRLLGFVEPVQCTMVLEEADKIDKTPELMSILKSGYSYYETVSKINPYTNKPEYFYAYCPKIIISERSLHQSIAKGVNSRTFSIPCIKGSTKHDIKEVLNPTDTGGPENKKLLKEIIFFRKLLLVYRLRHFKDPIPDLDIGVEGRDKELVKYCIQLFYGSKCLNEVIETLQIFLDIKNEKKKVSIEYVLLPIISTLIKYNGNELSSRKIWEEIIKEIPGNQDEKKPVEYHTEDYGTLYRTTISGTITDSFGASIRHSKNGNILIFDRETIDRLIKEDKTRITVNLKQQKNEGRGGEGVNSVNSPGQGGYPGSEETKSETEQLDNETDTIQGFQLSPDGPIHYNDDTTNIDDSNPSK